MTPASLNPKTDRSRDPLPRGHSARLAVALAVWAALLAGMAWVPAVSAYHSRVRGVFLSLAPLTAGYALGALAAGWARRHIRIILGGSAGILLAALLPRLNSGLPAFTTATLLLAGIGVSVALVRLGMLQAGISWGGFDGNPDNGAEEEAGTAPRWAAVLALAFAWSWLALAVWNPRETFPPTRWLLTITGAKPSAAALAPPRVLLRRFRATLHTHAPQRRANRAVRTGAFLFTVDQVAPGPGTVAVAVTARRADGAPFGRPVWLTLDVDDVESRTPPADTRLSTGRLGAHSPNAGTARQAAAARGITGVAGFSLSQSLPAIRVHARLWTLDRRAPDGDLLFRPLADAPLGRWDLTPRRFLRPQGMNHRGQ